MLSRGIARRSAQPPRSATTRSRKRDTRAASAPGRVSQAIRKSYRLLRSSNRIRSSTSWTSMSASEQIAKKRLAASCSGSLGGRGRCRIGIAPCNEGHYRPAPTGALMQAFTERHPVHPLGTRAARPLNSPVPRAPYQLPLRSSARLLSAGPLARPRRSADQCGLCVE